jgi:hypothetical protein
MAREQRASAKAAILSLSLLLHITTMAKRKKDRVPQPHTVAAVDVLAMIHGDNPLAAEGFPEFRPSPVIHNSPTPTYGFKNVSDYLWDSKLRVYEAQTEWNGDAERNTAIWKWVDAATIGCVTLRSIMRLLDHL